MAGTLIRYAGKSEIGLMEFVLDKIDEIPELPTTEKFGTGIFSNYEQFAPIGSTAIVGNDGGDLIVYMLFSFGWKKL
jgi:hypothetical protein